MKKILSVMFLASTLLSTTCVWSMDDQSEKRSSAPGALVPFQTNNDSQIAMIDGVQYDVQKCVAIVKGHVAYEALNERQKKIPQSFVILNTSQKGSETGNSTKIKPYSYDRTEIVMNFLFVTDAGRFLSGEREFPKTSVSMRIGNDGCMYNYNQGPRVSVESYEDAAYQAFAANLRNSRGANHNLILESIQAKAYVNDITPCGHLNLSNVYTFDYSKNAELTSQIFGLSLNEDKKIVLEPIPR